MRKRTTFQHLDSDRSLVVDFLIDLEDGHWVARLEYPGGENQEVKAPTFYGSTEEQAERQLRKVFEREYDLVSQVEIGE